MSTIKVVQYGDALSYECYGKTIATKSHKEFAWIWPLRLLTPNLMQELKTKIEKQKRRSTYAN